jgi:hypothetical protein
MVLELSLTHSSEESNLISWILFNKTFVAVCAAFGVTPIFNEELHAAYQYEDLSQGLEDES